MPNRNGMVFWKGLWNVDGKPDTHNTACMRDCVAKVDVSSSLPPYARDLNGNLAEQMRIVGPVRGVDTLEPALRSEEHQYEFQLLMRNSYAVFCLKKTIQHNNTKHS